MSDNGKPDIRVRVFPSGMIEVYGADADAVGLVAAAASKGMYRPKSTEGQAELPLTNGMAQDRLAPVESVVNRNAKNGPFVDRSVTRYHPAVLALEQDNLRAPTGAEFDHYKMRCTVGKYITGTWRECQTRAIGTLMARLVEDGIVASTGRGKWKKLPKVTK